MPPAAPARAARLDPRLPVPAAPPPAVNPRDHAIVVGIQHYLEGIPSLLGSINDCNLFCEWLVDPQGGGVDPNNITFYASIDPTDQCPFGNQVANLILDLQQQAWRNQTPLGRRLYLFFSGHGVAPPNHSDDCGLVMANALPAGIRAFIGGKVATDLRRSGWFEEVVLVMDCCREVTGNVIDESVLPPFVDPAAGEKPFLHILAAGWGAATSERMLPNPLDPTKPQLQQGVLTHAFLRALKLARDEDGNVSAESLKRFIPPLVESLTGESSKEPLIDFRPSLPPIIFGKSRGLQFKVKLNDGTAGFRLRRGTDLTDITAEATRNGRTYTFWLAPGLHLIERLDVNGAAIGSEIRNILEGGGHVRL